RERTIFARITNRPEEAVAFLVFDFGVGEGRPRLRIPVDEPRSAVHEALPIELHEDFVDGGREFRIHREALALPIGPEAERAKRFVDSAPIELAPFPDAGDE